MQINTENIREQIPYYLTQEAKEHLVKALNSFPDSIEYYIDRYHGEVLQGDGWTSFDVIQFHDGKRKEVKGIVLSNSCDISSENRRDLPTKITFAPIINLNRFKNLLLATKKFSEQQINSRFQSIRAQEITNIFYLPAGGGLEDEYIARLNDLYTMPSELFFNNPTRTKLFTLSQVGFYIFVFKLSVHFCRFHERLDRGQTSAEAI